MKNVMRLYAGKGHTKQARTDSIRQRSRRPLVQAALLAFTLIPLGLLAACGGGAAKVPAKSISVYISPAAAAVDQGDTVQFTAGVGGSSNQAVTWSIQEGAAGGTISPSGLYTAPGAAMTVHVVATSVADPSKSFSATVTVNAVNVILPATVLLPRGRERQFAAVVTGTVTRTVTWSVVEAGGGTITADGVYTAPMSGGPFHVTARSVADSTKAATATVTLTDAGFRLLDGATVEPRNSPTATLLPNGMVLIAGGNWCSGSNCSALASAELFNPATETFFPTGSMSRGRTGHTATLLNDGTVLITGGVRPSGSIDGTAEIYDPATATFTQVGDMAEERAFHTAALLADGRVLIAGGRQGELSGFSDSAKTAEIYDPATHSFSPAGLLPWGTTFHTASVLQDGTVLVAGGDGVSSCPNGTSGLARYDVASNSFQAGADLPQRRMKHTATMLNDGRVLFAGGLDPCQSLNVAAQSATAVVFDPAANTYSPEAAMREPREGHTATLLNDGTVLVVGSLADRFDPATSVFIATGDPYVSGAGRSATRLADGRVLFVGAGAVAEIYE
jgi:hypothetical protein